MKERKIGSLITIKSRAKFKLDWEQSFVWLSMNSLSLFTLSFCKRKKKERIEPHDRRYCSVSS